MDELTDAQRGNGYSWTFLYSSVGYSDNPTYMLELAKGIEPSTCGLQNRCSAN